MTTRRSVLKGVALSTIGGAAGAYGHSAHAGARDRKQAGKSSCEFGHYDIQGNGPAVVCSHGFMMDRTMFRPQMESLATDFRVAAYDSRARTSRGLGRYDLYDLADDCVDLIDHLRIRRCVLVGMSMGGWMALRFALKYPDRLDGLVLIDSSAGVDDNVRRNDFAGRFEALRGKNTLPADYADWVVAQMFGAWTKENNAGLVDAWYQKFLKLSGDAVYWEAESWLDRDDMSHKVSTIQLPTLVLHGAQDTAEALSEVQPMIDAMPNAELVVIENAGHTSNLEQPVSTNDAIRRFLKSIYG